MKRICIIVLFFTMLVACTKGDHMIIEFSDPQLDIDELVTKKYTDDELTKISCFSGNIENLMEEYSVECIRQENCGFRAVFCGDASILVFHFDSTFNTVGGHIYSKSYSLSEYKKLLGKTMLQVKSFDPKGSFPFLYAGRNDLPTISFHCTSDNYFLYITYEDNIVVNITYERL